MNDLRQKIEATNKQLEKLKAKKKALQAKERNARRVQKRKDETRLKIILGAALLKMEKQEEETGGCWLEIDGKPQMVTLGVFLDKYITAERDRQFIETNYTD